MKKLLTLALLLGTIPLSVQASWVDSAKCLFIFCDQKTQTSINQTATQESVNTNAVSASSTNSLSTSFQTSDQITIVNFAEITKQLLEGQAAITTLGTEYLQNAKTTQQYWATFAADPPTLPVANPKGETLQVNVGQSEPPFTVKLDNADRALLQDLFGSLTVALTTISNTLSTTSMPFPTPGGGSGSSVSKSIAQTAHGFSVNQWVYVLSSGVYALTDADVPTTADNIGMVTAVADANNFTVTQIGYVTGLSGKTPGAASFLSSTAGAITETEPTGVSTTRKPVFIAETATTGWIIDRPGTPVAGSTAVVQYGEQLMTNGSTFTTSLVDITGGTVTIPSAGTWEVEYFAYYTHNTGGSSVSFGLYDTGNTLIAGSQSFSASVSGSTASPLNTQRVTVITTAATTYKLKAITSAGTGTIVNSGTGTITSANSKITYTQIGASPVPMDLVGEKGWVSVNAQTFSTTSFVDSTNGIYALPSAGTWRLRYDLATDGTGLNTNSQFAITDSANTIVAGSEKVRGGSVTTAQGLNAEVFVTTTGAATYKLRGRSGGGGAGSASILNATNNDSTISWEKVSGFLPSSGQTVDFVSGTLTTSQTTNLGVGDHIKFDTLSTGNIPLDTTTTYSSTAGAASIGRITLTAGKTYKLSGQIALASNAANGNAAYQWFNATTGTAIPGASIGRLISPNNASTNQSGGISEAIITPSSTTLVELRLLSAVTTPIDGSQGTSIFIQQLGTSAVIAGVYPGTWTTYTPTVTATSAGTNPTLPTSAVISGSYTIQGKVMLLNFKYYAPTTAGGADGTQSYAYSIPAGYTIDTTKAAIPTVLTNTSGSGFDGGTIGSGFGRNSTGGNSAGLGFVPVSTTAFGIYFEPQNRLVGASALAATGASNTVIYGTLQIPIN